MSQQSQPTTPTFTRTHSHPGAQSCTRMFTHGHTLTALLHKYTHPKAHTLVCTIKHTYTATLACIPMCMLRQRLTHTYTQKHVCKHKRARSLTASLYSCVLIAQAPCPNPIPGASGPQPVEPSGHRGAYPWMPFVDNIQAYRARNDPLCP